jgi:hypothetical protein
MRTESGSGIANPDGTAADLGHEPEVGLRREVGRAEAAGDAGRAGELHLALMNEGYYQMSLGYFLLSAEVTEDDIDGFLAALDNALRRLGYS